MMKRDAVKQQYRINKNLKLNYLMPNKLLISLLEQYEFEFIDPTICLKRKPNIKITYYNNDNHLTKYGHKLYYEYIRDEFLIKFK